MAEPQTKAKAKCKWVSPHFVVPDVVASAEHYRDFLGFKILSNFGFRLCLSLDTSSLPS